MLTPRNNETSQAFAHHINCVNMRLAEGETLQSQLRSAHVEHRYLKNLDPFHTRLQYWKDRIKAIIQVNMQQPTA